ncbi:MAG: hypothetical protein EBS84_15160 [Proteobacteria bacterium]|nr:hypothetical protein [Verrucomicrobiota bacterium]NBU10332.1 hypothetical protein [Pseudomonadota bacterium]
MNLELTRKLAILQATAAQLRETSRSFTETSDMFAHRQFQFELAEYLGTHRAAGDIPYDPDVYVGEELDRIERLLEPVAKFVKEQLELGKEILEAKKNSLTLPQIQECQTNVDAAFNALVETQHRLASGFLNKDLSVEPTGIDLAPDLVVFTKLARPKSTLMQPDRAGLCQFAHGEGPLHAQVVTHLETLRAACAEFIALHAEQAEILQRAYALAEAGDFARAAALVAELKLVFADLPYQQVTEVIDGWRKKLEEVEAKFTRHRERVETPWKAPFAQPWLVPPHQRAEDDRLQQFHDYLVKFHGSLEAWKNSDFAREGHSLFKKLVARLDALRDDLRQRCDAAQTRAVLELGGLVLLGVLTALFPRKLLPVIAPFVAVFGLVKLAGAVRRNLQARTSVSFRLEANGRQVEDPEKSFIRLNGETVRSGDRIAAGTYKLTLDTSFYEPLTRTVTVHFGRSNNLGIIPVKLNRDTHTNTLGMRFMPVPGATVLFCVWPTRVQDYAAFVQATQHKWIQPKFRQEPTHPAVNVSWDDARAFCKWLTEKEFRAGRIGERDCYRLPTDLEWSAAVDLGKETGATPAERDGKIRDVYPWGKDWPPPKNVGNYDGELRRDDFDYTSPVGSFPANRHGLHDLGGNVWEWCQDDYDNQQGRKVLRGASWHSSKAHTLLSSARLFNSPGHRIDIVGFRCVLDARRPSPVFSSLEKGNPEPAASSPAPPKSEAQANSEATPGPEAAPVFKEIA